MISRSKKPENGVESDSDWDSLPGDVPEPGSSPEPKSPLPRAPAHSPVLSPAPPKQPYSKHHATTKPVNIYKNSLNPIRQSGSATKFEDRTGGIDWNDDDNNDDIRVSFSKENNNNVKKKNEVVRGKRDSSRNIQQQEKNKRPPYTDFREALSTPIPAAPNLREQQEMVGVNQAYQVEIGDEMKANHDSWDNSENESQIQQSDGHWSTSDAKPTKRELSVDRSSCKAKHKPRMMKGDNDEVGTIEMRQHFSSSQNFENCCLIQVADGAFDDRYRPSFFHGSKNHFHVREDNPRAAITDIAEKSEVILQRFWREVFGVVQILLNVFIIFILELFKTIILSVRYLLTGILYTIGDHFIKPLLSAIFNNIIQPFSVLLLNVFTIFANLLKPILALTREILSQVAIPLKAFRLFVFNWEYRGKNAENRSTDVKYV